MKSLTITMPRWCELNGPKSWEARYKVTDGTEVKLIHIEARSFITVVVSKVTTTGIFTGIEYYISSPNFNTALPSISSLLETTWIIEKLISCNMPDVDAITVAHVLEDIGDF